MSQGDRISQRLLKAIALIFLLLFLVLLANLIYTQLNKNSNVSYETIAGPTGKNGVNGPKGDTGSEGDRGPIGAKGDTGPQGSNGPKGDTGQNGNNGQDGPPGPQGLTGLTGETGLQGIQGAAGVDGRQIELRSNDTDKTIEWHYIGDTSWQVLVRYCDLTSSCLNPENTD